MGKRSDFKRRKHDQYLTPEKPVHPLVPHLPAGRFTFTEPCAGDGRLITHLEYLTNGDCIEACDIDPQRSDIVQRNAMSIKDTDADLFITNPPWTREILHPLIVHLSDIKPTWLLFDGDWLFTGQAEPFLPRLRKVVAVGRVSWMENGVSGKDNAAWYLFDKHTYTQTEFYGKEAA